MPCTEPSDQTVLHDAAILAANADVSQLATAGYVLLRGAVPPLLVSQAQTAFEAGYLPSGDWAVPRGFDWRHARVDLDPAVQQICHLPPLLHCAGRIIAEPFFLMQVDGRDPCHDNPTQPLHRDIEPSTPRCAIALVFLDDFGPDNGATQVVPGSHLTGAGSAAPVCLSGQAGDALVMDGFLLHGGTTNHSGKTRRSLLATYASAALRDHAAETAVLRGVAMAAMPIMHPRQ